MSLTQADIEMPAALPMPAGRLLIDGIWSDSGAEPLPAAQSLRWFAAALEKLYGGIVLTAATVLTDTVPWNFPVMTGA